MHTIQRTYPISMILLAFALASCGTPSAALRANAGAAAASLEFDDRGRPIAVGGQRVEMTERTDSAEYTSVMVGHRQDVWQAWGLKLVDDQGRLEASCSGAAFNELRHSDPASSTPTIHYGQPTAAVCHAGQEYANQPPLLAWLGLASGCDNGPVGEVRIDGKLVTLRCSGPVDGESELVREVALELEGVTLAWLHLGREPELAMLPGLPRSVRRSLERASAVALGLNAVLPPARNGDQVQAWASPQVASIQQSIRQASARSAQ